MITLNDIREFTTWQDGAQVGHKAWEGITGDEEACIYGDGSVSILVNGEWRTIAEPSNDKDWLNFLKDISAISAVKK